MNFFISRLALAVLSVTLTACSPTPMEKGKNDVIHLGCSLGNGDAFADSMGKKVDLDYSPKEELKLFNFEGYTVPDTEKEGLKQLFKLSARGCYLDAVKRQDPTKFK